MSYRYLSIADELGNFEYISRKAQKNGVLSQIDELEYAELHSFHDMAESYHGKCHEMSSPVVARET